MTSCFLYLLFSLMVAAVPYVTGEGIALATGEWSETASQLRLNCTLSPDDPARGCLFVMLRHNSNETIESILVLPEITGCTTSGSQISCCDVECSVSSLARFIAYPVYEAGVVDPIGSVEGNITLNDIQLCERTNSEIEESIYKLSKGAIAGITIHGVFTVIGWSFALFLSIFLCKIKCQCCKNLNIKC